MSVDLGLECFSQLARAFRREFSRLSRRAGVYKVFSSPRAILCCCEYIAEDR